MRRIRTALPAMLAASLLTTTSAAAQTPLTDGGWTIFTFAGVGSGASGQPFTFTSSEQFYITVLDAAASGDQFELFDGATLVGTSTVPTIGAPFCSTGPTCLLDSAFSRGTFLLDAGSYNFDVHVLASPFGQGSAFIGVNVSRELAGIPGGMSTVPEPGTVVLTGAGLALLMGFARRRANAG